MPRFAFDPTISLGQLITAGTIVVTVTAAWVNVSTRVDALERGGADREARLRAMELAVASQAANIGSMRETLGEIKSDVRQLLEGSE